MATGPANRLDARTARLSELVAGARLRLIAVAFAAGILLSLFLALAWIVGGVLLDLLAPLPVALRSAVFLGWWGAVAAAVGLFVLLPAVRRPLLDAVALRIERVLGGIQNRLLTVIDLHRGGAATRGWKDDPARQGMAERLVEQTEERLRGFSLGRIVRYRALGRGAALVAGAVLVLLGMQAGLGERFTTTVSRLLHPTADIPPATWLRIESPGDIEVLEGDPLGIVAHVTRGSVAAVDLVISSADGRDRREPMRPDGDGGFVATLDGLDHDATYRIEGGGTWTKTHAIRLLGRPSIESVAGRVRLPEYMRIDQPLRVVPDSPRIEAPVGSTVEFVAEVAGEASDGVLRLLERKLETTLVERIDERVWFEDDLPRDAVAASPWKWTTAHAAGGLRSFTFAADGRPLEMKTRLEPLVLPKETLEDRALSVMVRRDPSDPPTRLSITLVHEGGAVEVVWGNDDAGPAADLRVPRIVAGALPEPGDWGRVAAPLATLPLLVGRSVTGVTFAIDKGRMLLDRPGWMERSMQPVQQPVDRTLEEFAASRMEGGDGGLSTWTAGVPVTLRSGQAGAEGGAVSPRQASRKPLGNSEPVWATLEFRSPQGYPSRALPPVEIVGTLDRPPSLVVEEPQSELIQLTALDEFELVAHLFDDWGIDMVGFRVGADEQSLGDPQPLDELPLVKRPPDTQVVLQTSISPDRIGLSPGSSGAFKLVVRDTKGQWAESRAFRIMVLVAEDQAPPPPALPALDEALREATQALRLAERDEAILDKKREETLAAIGPEPLAALDRAEQAAEAAKEAATDAAAKATDPQALPEEKAAAEQRKSAAEVAATAQTADAQTRTDAAVATASETVKQDLETLDQYLEARRQDVGQVAGKLAQAAEQARGVPEVSSQQQEQLAAAAAAAADLRDQLQTSPQFQADAAKVDRLADAPKPSEIADRLEAIAEQARAVARQLDAADKAREVDSLVNDLAERAEGLDMLGQQRRDLQAQQGRKPDSAAQAALDRQTQNDVRQVNQIVGPERQKPTPPPAEGPDADPLQPLVDSARDTAREAADAAARIAQQLAGKLPLAPQAGQGDPGQAGEPQGQPAKGAQPGEGNQPGEGSKPAEPGNPQSAGRAPTAKELEAFLGSREVQETLQMAARSQRLQQQSSKRAADQMARGQQGAAQKAASDKQGQGEGQPGAKPTGEPTQVATDGGAEVGQAAIKAADLRGLDAARRAAIYKLPPRVRDPLLEGMRERGPAAYQEVIDTYFRHLGKDIPQ